MTQRPDSSQVVALDAFFAPFDRTTIDPAEYGVLRAAWRAHVRAHRAATRISSTSLPAVSEAAMEAIQARAHIDRSIAAMGGVTAGREDPELKDK